MRKSILHLIDGVLEKNSIKRTSENSNFYDRFVIHLNYFLDSLDRSENENKSLMETEKQVRLIYPLAYRIGSDTYDIVTREVGVGSYKCEKVFLVLRIQRLL